MVDGDISCPSEGNSDGRPWGDQMTVRGEFCWPPMGSFAWPPSLGCRAGFGASEDSCDPIKMTRPEWRIESGILGT